MKPLKSIYLFFIFILLLVLFGFYACKKDAKTTADLTGKWISESNQASITYQDVYQFNADGTFSQTRLTVDANKQPVSYQYISNGKYQVSGDQLTLTDVTIKYNNYYVALNQLTSTLTEPGPVTNTVAVNNDKTEFHFVYPPCPANASCLGQISYYKK